MRIKFSKIQAFTLSEMLVVLLITTLVVGLSYSVLNLVQQQMNGMGDHYDKKAEMNRLKQALWLDFNLCDRVYIQDRNSQLVFDAPTRNGSYVFLQDRIIRQQDTFYIGNYGKQFYFENSSVTIGELDAILLNSELETQNSELFIYKSNSATSYINN